jgi:hypothetical protein
VNQDLQPSRQPPQHPPKEHRLNRGDSHRVRDDRQQCGHDQRAQHHRDPTTTARPGARDPVRRESPCGAPTSRPPRSCRLRASRNLNPRPCFDAAARRRRCDGTAPDSIWRTSSIWAIAWRTWADRYGSAAGTTVSKRPAPGGGRTRPVHVGAGRRFDPDARFDVGAGSVGPASALRPIGPSVLPDGVSAGPRGDADETSPSRPAGAYMPGGRRAQSLRVVACWRVGAGSALSGC